MGVSLLIGGLLFRLVGKEYFLVVDVIIVFKDVLFICVVFSVLNIVRYMVVWFIVFIVCLKVEDICKRFIICLILVEWFLFVV